LLVSAVDAVLGSIITTPVRAPARERDLRTLDRHRPTRVHRPHRALSQRPLHAGTQIALADDTIRVRRRDRLGGLIHEYSQVA
jgi:hypothetical protein